MARSGDRPGRPEGFIADLSLAGKRYWLTKQQSEADVPVKAVEPVAKVKRVEKYHFSFGAESPPAGSISLNLDDKVRLFVRHLIANQLRTAIDEVDDARHLMETGITSLDMAEITQSIKLGVDEDFSPIAFFECTTIRSFATLLTQRYAAAFEKLTVTRQTVEEGDTVVPLRKKAELPQATSDSLVPLHVQDAVADLPIGDAKSAHTSAPGKSASIVPHRRHRVPRHPCACRVLETRIQRGPRIAWSAQREQSKVCGAF